MAPMAMDSAASAAAVAMIISLGIAGGGRQSENDPENVYDPVLAAENEIRKERGPGVLLGDHR